MIDQRILRLRLELYTAAQTLKGDDAKEFWALIAEIESLRAMYEPKP